MQINEGEDTIQVQILKYLCKLTNVKRQFKFTSKIIYANSQSSKVSNVKSPQSHFTPLGTAISKYTSKPQKDKFKVSTNRGSSKLTLHWAYQDSTAHEKSQTINSKSQSIEGVQSQMLNGQATLNMNNNMRRCQNIFQIHLTNIYDTFTYTLGILIYKAKSKL
jgi:hypothetical protein